MRLVAQGLSDAQVASRLGVSESTVGKHLEHVYERTGAHSRVEAVRRCSPSVVDVADDLAAVPGS